MKSIMKLLLPITLSNMLGLLAVLINIRIVGNVSENNFYLLSLFLPINYWIVSLFESLKVPATAISANALGKDDMTILNDYIWVLSLIGFLGVIIPISIFLLNPMQIEMMLGIMTQQSSNTFFIFSISMLGSSIFLIIFFILTGVMNGIGMHKVVTFISLISVSLSVIINYFLCNYTRLDILSLPCALFVSYSIMSVFLIVLLFKKNIINFSFQSGIISSRVINNIKKITLPVWLTYFLLIFSVFIFNKILSVYGSDVVAGFGIAFRIQTIIILPAISMGIVLGILLNKHSTSPNKNSNYNILLKGIFICVVFYFILDFFVYRFSYNLISLMTSNEMILLNSKKYFDVISFSYIGLAISLCYSVMLEQIGYGFWSFLFNICIILCEVILAIFLRGYFPGPECLYASIVIGNILSGFITFTLVLVNFPKNLQTRFSYC